MKNERRVKGLAVSQEALLLMLQKGISLEQIDIDLPKDFECRGMEYAPRRDGWIILFHSDTFPEVEGWVDIPLFETAITLATLSKIGIVPDHNSHYRW